MSRIKTLREAYDQVIATHKRLAIVKAQLQTADDRSYPPAQYAEISSRLQVEKQAFNDAATDFCVVAARDIRFYNAQKLQAEAMVTQIQSIYETYTDKEDVAHAEAT